jgi:predicted DNA-binding transcriptional regulator AlpA
VDKQSIELTYAANFGAPVMMSCKDICKLLNISKSTFYSRVVVSANFPKSFTFFGKVCWDAGEVRLWLSDRQNFH